MAGSNIQPLVGGLVGRPLDLTAATASSSFSSLSPPPSLLCSLLTVAATVPERPRPAPEDKRRQQMEKPPKLLISLANLWTRQVFLDFRHHHHSLLITSQPSHCSYRIVSKRQKPPWPKKWKLSDIFVRLNWDFWKSSLVYLFVCLFVCGALGTGRQAEQWIDGTRCPPHPPPLPTCPPPLQAPHDHWPHDQWPTTWLHTRRLQNWPISATSILVIIWPMLTNNGWSLGHTVMTIGMFSQALCSVGLLIFNLDQTGLQGRPIIKSNLEDI